MFVWVCMGKHTYIVASDDKLRVKVGNVQWHMTDYMISQNIISAIESLLIAYMIFCNIL